MASTGNNYLWQLEEVDGVKAIKNIGTGDYMNIENLTGYVQCTTRVDGSLKAEWSTEDTGDGYVRIKSVAQTNTYIHVENLQNQAQYGSVEPSWWSAMWLMEPVKITTSVNQLTAEEILQIYPNPTRGDFMLRAGDFSRREKVTITVFNLAGQAMIAQTAMTDDNGNILVTITTGKALSPGNYYVVAKGNSYVARGKVPVVQ